MSLTRQYRNPFAIKGTPEWLAEARIRAGKPPYQHMMEGTVAMVAECTQCECMDGPNQVDSTCLYCGGTGIYASDERLAELVRHYTYLVEHTDGISRRQFKASDQQHVAIFKALQIARADEMRRVREVIAKP